jgi:acetyl/propionyl-CoA carboxylase alpha subunit
LVIGRAETLEIEVLAIGEGEVCYLVDGVRRWASFARDGDALWVETSRAIGRYEVSANGSRAAAASDHGELRAPMAAQVVAVAVAPGDRVARDASLVTLRAMKLEHRVAAPWEAIVRDVLVREGEQVTFRQVMIRLDAVAGPLAGTEVATR